MATQTVAIDADESTDETPFPKALIELTQDAMRSFGYSVNILELCTVSQNSKIAKTGREGRTPAFMTDQTDTAEMVRNGTPFPFTVEKELSGYFGESTGSSNVTTFFVRDGLKLTEVIEKFHVTGQIEAGAKKIAPFIDSETDALDVVAYAIATYAKGWFAERLLAETDRFSKGSVSQDKGGLDLYDKELSDWVQVKCVTFDKQVNDHIYYQFDMRGNLHFGTDYLSVHAHAVNVTGMPKTVTRRCHSSYKDESGQTYRYIWW